MTAVHALAADTTTSGAIVSIETYVLRVPLRRTLADAIYERTHWHIPVVEITTGDGLVGTGYSGVWAGEDVMCDIIDRYLAPQLIGRDSSLIGALWREMYWSPLHWIGRAGAVHMSQAMIDIALWDLAAQHAGLPLWRLLGGTHTELDSYNTDGGWLNFTTDELVADMTAMAESGWKRVKMKVGGGDPDVDIARVAAVRTALPQGVTLMVDANQRWDLMTATRMASALADLGVAWLEEPLHPDDVGGHASLAARSRIPIALGENLYSAEAFENFLSADAVDIVQVDVTRVAGVTEWLRVAHAAQARSRWVVPHAGDMMQVHQHLAAGIGAGRRAMIEYLPWALEAFDEPVRVDAGAIQLPESPGASSRIKPEARAEWGTFR